MRLKPLTLEEVVMPSAPGRWVRRYNDVGSRLTGWAQYHEYEGGDWLLSEVYVVPTARGKGIATDLLEEVLRQAQEADATVVLAVRPGEFTSMDEIALREWYLRHGFKDHARWGEMGVLVTI